MELSLQVRSFFTGTAHCGLCRVSFLEVDDLHSHLSAHLHSGTIKTRRPSPRQSDAQATEGNKHECCFCGIKFQLKSSLKQHTDRVHHSGTQKQVCDAQRVSGQPNALAREEWLNCRCILTVLRTNCLLYFRCTSANTRAANRTSVRKSAAAAASLASTNCENTRARTAERDRTSATSVATPSRRCGSHDRFAVLHK